MYLYDTIVYLSTFTKYIIFSHSVSCYYTCTTKPLSTRSAIQSKQPRVGHMQPDHVPTNRPSSALDAWQPNRRLQGARYPCCQVDWTLGLQVHPVMNKMQEGS